MTHLPRRTLTLLVLLLSVTVAAAADADKTQRLTVPLTDPGRPVKLSAALVTGGLTVEAHEGKDVIIEVASEEPQEPSARTGGMRVIPNRSLGLTVEEADNEVSLSSDYTSRVSNLVVKVPRKTSVAISTVNEGDIVVRGVEGELELNNVNGAITALDVAGSVVAHTTNGDVKVTFTSIEAGKSMSFVTFNGDVDITFPPGLKADLRMKTGQGEIYTDFDFDLVPVESEMKAERQGKKYRVQLNQDVRARIAGGGAEIHFNTWNGDIFIRKRGGSSGR